MDAHRPLAPPSPLTALSWTRPSTTRLRSFSYDSDYERDTSEYVLDSGVVDYYAVLNVDDDADASEIKAAYRSIAKVCHPDISGDESMNMCILLNEAYTVLSDPEQRSEYNRMLDEALEDENDGYTGQMLSKWMAGTKMGKNEDPNETRGVFVDECSCIGCKQCVWLAPATFRIEEEWGRSRVFGQWLDTEDDISAAIDSCPVSCIYWIEKEDLPPLEYVTQNVVKRVDVGMMMAGQGGGGQDVWAVTAKYMKEREEKRKQREKAAFYSRAQAAARAAAAEALARKQMGWFDEIVQKFGVADAAERMKQSVQSSVTGSLSEDEYEAYARVGKRKRAKRPTDDGTYGARGENGGKVPANRAIVVSSGGKKVWER